MVANLFNFTSGQSSPDPSAQAGIQQYIAQGQQQIDPGQAQVAQSNPTAAGGMANLARAFAQQQQQPQLPAQQNLGQNGFDAMSNGAVMQPNMNGQNMGGVGPTVQNAQAAQLANLLQPQGGQ